MCPFDGIFTACWTSNIDLVCSISSLTLYFPNSVVLCSQCGEAEIFIAPICQSMFLHNLDARLTKPSTPAHPTEGVLLTSYRSRMTIPFTQNNSQPLNLSPVLTVALPSTVVSR
ncbi:hypothetical protein HA466_0063480 [Hirschfeldia incana]|nr:hypothetical protein HA466_0063480 [Hirschfeldia incana]